MPGMTPNRAFGKLGSRIGARIRLGVAGDLAMPHGTCDCTIEDVSRSGARITIARRQPGPGPRVGTPAMLRFHEGEMLGTIVWSSGDRCAIRFDRPAQPADLERLRWISENPEQFAQAQMGTASALWR